MPGEIGEDVGKRIGILYCAAASLWPRVAREARRQGFSMMALADARRKTIMAAATAVRGESFILAARAPESAAINIFNLSRCLKSMRSPFTLAVSVPCPECMARYLEALYAPRLAALAAVGDAVRSGRASLRERIYYRLHRRAIEDAMKMDRVAAALAACQRRVRGRSTLAGEALRLVSMASKPVTVLMDGEERTAALVRWEFECPKRSLAYIDAQGMVAAVAIEQG